MSKDIRIRVLLSEYEGLLEVLSQAIARNNSEEIQGIRRKLQSVKLDLRKEGIAI